jgi:release factor glutamine methyltransferase
MAERATIASAVTDAAHRLRGIADDPRREARLLLAHALGLTLEALIRDPARPIDATLFNALLARRLAREPMALILGRQGFWNLDLYVGPATLIPRPDSETLMEAALALQAGHPPARILDLGTGTGCLLLALLSEHTTAFGIGTDINPAAAALARRNAARLGLSSRAAFICADWTACLNQRFDLIVSNPPYIKTADINGLMPEVRLHEPRTALDGGKDGLTAYRLILARLPALLAPSGLAILELGIGQASDVTAIAATAGFNASLHADLGGINRAIALQFART